MPLSGDGRRRAGLQPRAPPLPHPLHPLMGHTARHAGQQGPLAVLHPPHPGGPAPAGQRLQQPRLGAQELLVHGRARVPAAHLLPRPPAGAARVPKPVPPEEGQRHQPGGGGKTGTERESCSKARTLNSYSLLSINSDRAAILAGQIFKEHNSSRSTASKSTVKIICVCVLCLWP